MKFVVEYTVLPDGYNQAQFPMVRRRVIEADYIGEAMIKAERNLLLGANCTMVTIAELEDNPIEDL